MSPPHRFGAPLLTTSPDATTTTMNSYHLHSALAQAHIADLHQAAATANRTSRQARHKRTKPRSSSASPA